MRQYLERVILLPCNMLFIYKDFLSAPPALFLQEEAARERLEERKRRQALFLHKKRRPRKVERKASFNSATHPT